MRAAARPWSAGMRCPWPRKRRQMEVDAKTGGIVCQVWSIIQPLSTLEAVCRLPKRLGILLFRFCLVSGRKVMCS